MTNPNLIENHQKMQGERLKRLRKQMGLSAQQLAHRLSESGTPVSRGAIANWECGKNGIASSKLASLASILNTTESFLLTGRTQMDEDAQSDDDQIHHQHFSSQVMTMNTANTPLKKSAKLANVCYDIRGELLQTANRMEAEGHRIIKLNIGNPEPFGLLPPDEIVQDVAMNLHNASGYSDSKGIFAARKAILQYYQGKGLLSATDVNDVFIGNGVSELIVMVMQALLDDGDEVLIPMPDYPLWTAAANLAGGKAVHYRCVEENNWQPDLADIENKITPKTKGIVVINPNNPTGALYSDEILQAIADLAVKYGLVLMADEIYDRILYDDAVHTPICTITDKALVLTFNGLSKSHRIAGYRSGWVMISGKKDHADDFIEGLAMLASMRLCANVPAQYAIQTAMGGYQSMQALTAPSGRLYKQRQLAVDRLNAIKGISCTMPQGAFYCFAKIDRKVYPIDNDMKFMMDLLIQEKVLMVQGTGFNWDKPDHFRVVFLPNLIDLEDAMDRLDRFFANKRKEFGTE
ncbi:aminotransferase class I/II-fold pyridoxal phosphate-dependent enzyme [Moraxella haemolytica]|uniref:aminotransferase class I/II-fold pyridoxal phosphate-dependent enzyme n=1 Tax=Moraxella haemolytica TaxID=2904119 RepID=UPI00254279B5|nr:aminotransferase class I/II-fold pyridoxal phosphate-dependent enzyme [Moraxella sp. ZY171148]WII95884.1 aminotransferase class I/II-fold pyridoxal phosphate-dependent enzyme [Moraxella sp. ZY171148]